MLYRSQDVASRDAQEKNQLIELLLQASPNYTYPASLAQQRLWFLDQLRTGNTAYNVHLGMWLRGPLDLAALQSSVQEMVSRHDSLRTSFRIEREKLHQVVEGACPATIPITDLTGVADPTAEAYQLARREVQEPFDLSKAPLFRVRLFRATPLDHVFLCTMHHIITDAWSVQIFAKELEQLYRAFSRGEASPLPALPIRYGDFAEWQLEWFHCNEVQQQLAYWKNKLKGAPALLELATDAPRPPEQTFEGAVEVVAIPQDVIEGIERVAARCQVTPFMVELAAFKVLLSRYAQQHDIVVGIPVAGRNRVETEGLIGFFVNTLVLRDNLAGNPRFTDVIAQVRETILGAFSNVDVPFEKIVEELQPERNLGYNPLFQVMFATLKSAVRSHKFGDLTAFPYVVSGERSIFDLSMTLIEDVDRQWWAQVEYNTNLFRRERISRMLSDYASVLEGVVSDPDSHILSLPLPSLPRLAGDLNMTAEKKGRKEKQKVTPSASIRRAAERHSEPLDGDQELLVEIWKEVLGVPKVGIRDSFFDLGGHSLLAVRLIAQIQEITGRHIPVSAIFRAPTIEGFAPLLRENLDNRPDPLLLKLQEGDGIVPFFAIAAPGVDTFGLSLLARHMGSKQTVYKVQGHAPLIWGRPFTRQELRTLAQEYVAALRSVQPHGPYCLGGMCGGVLIAQEVILELESMQEEVGVFSIFDTWVLENSQIHPLWMINYYRKRFQYFRSLPRQEQLGTTKSFLKRLLRGKRNGTESEWGRAYWPGEEFDEPRFRAPVLLFKRVRQPYYYIRDRQMGWGARSTGGVEICELNCKHDEFLRQPHVGNIGQILAGRLRGIREAEMHKTDEFAPRARFSPGIRA
ncbi:MAG: condensation domain-containing protein [Candidatus Sulfotelmatobacter sp.]